MIDVIIPTRSGPDALRLLVNQISATAGYPHRIVYTGSNASASVNRNLGLSQAWGEAVVMVDDDIEFVRRSARWKREPVGFHGWLRVLAEALARPEVVMVSAQLFSWDGSYSYMTGLDDCGNKPRLDGETVVPSKRLLTACCGFKPYSVRFDEEFVGSGFEDIDFCNQLATVQPDGVFLVCHAAHAVHRNEAKEQRGENWKRNEAYYLKKLTGEARVT